MKIWSILFLFFYSITSYAFEFEGGVINIPGSFEGPIKKDMGTQGRIYAFRKLHRDGNGATLLQITVLTPDKKFPPLSDEKLKEGASHYLLMMLSGVERRRTNFHKTDIENIRISGVPAAKIHWSGNVKNKIAEGIMYSYIHNSNIISLHTQDYKKYNSRYINQAARAFEKIKINK